jgi:hypothetical protein
MVYPIREDWSDSGRALPILDDCTHLALDGLDLLSTHFESEAIGSKECIDKPSNRYVPRSSVSLVARTAGFLLSCDRRDLWMGTSMH